MSIYAWISLIAGSAGLLFFVFNVLDRRGRSMLVGESWSVVTLPAIDDETLIVTSPRRLSDEEIAKMREEWRRAMTGYARPGVIMLPPGCNFTRVRLPLHRKMTAADLGLV